MCMRCTFFAKREDREALGLNHQIWWKMVIKGWKHDGNMMETWWNNADLSHSTDFKRHCFADLDGQCFIQCLLVVFGLKKIEDSPMLGLTETMEMPEIRLAIACWPCHWEAVWRDSDHVVAKRGDPFPQRKRFVYWMYDLFMSGMPRNFIPGCWDFNLQVCKSIAYSSSIVADAHQVLPYFGRCFDTLANTRWPRILGDVPC